MLKRVWDLHEGTSVTREQMCFVNPNSLINREDVLCTEAKAVEQHQQQQLLPVR